uniref:Uncharacterized protein n=1 Tax=Anguilla anguilla TaxID=7936 RepID=A0A0E9UH99_ANGAN
MRLNHGGMHIFTFSLLCV